jgi:hypothetical protein
MCIINDLHDLIVFYVYGSSVEFKRYKHQRYRPMEHFDKKKLHNFSKFSYRHTTGQVHETFKNIFVSRQEGAEDLTAHVVATQAIVEDTTKIKKDGKVKDPNKE